MSKRNEETQEKKVVENKKVNTKRNYKGRPNRKDSRNLNKKDQMSVKGNLNPKGFVNNPNWYFSDAKIAEDMVAFPMNGFGAVTKAGNQMFPTVMGIYLNPSVGVTEYESSTDPLITIRGPKSTCSLGVNRAAQKLWYILTATSGRQAGYTKPNVALLLGGIGAMIETYEFIRRVFGIAYTYNQRNRSMPDMLWNAMHVDGDDYKKNAANYLKRMNTLLGVMNQLPIPGNLAWFAKCQDMYQKVFLDYPAEMAQMFIMCPATTWVLEEDDGFIGGAYLRTVDMCLHHEDIPNALISNSYIGANNAGTGIAASTTYPYYVPASRDVNNINIEPQPLAYYIDVFESQINALLFSSHFSLIYADILRAFDKGMLSRWSFDYIDEKYLVVPEFNEGFLWQIHNADLAYGIMSPTRKYWQTKWTGTQTYDDVAKYGTPCNDVYEWAATDTLLYNPNLTSYGRYDNSLSANVIIDKYSKVLDFPTSNPSTEERLELTRYAIAPYKEYIERPECDDASVDTTRYAFNYNLPDHWIEMAYIYRGYDDAPLIPTNSMFATGWGVINSTFNTLTTYDPTLTKFHHAPLLPLYHNYGTLSNARLNTISGEINAWAEIDAEWFKSVSDLIYVNLFDIR